MHQIWTSFLYQPLYNTLIFIVNTVSFGDLGFAVIILTLLVKTILFPISKKSIVGQKKLQQLEGEIASLKQKYPNKEEQAKKTFELYKKNKVNPFSGCILLLIQFPIIIALYYVFYKGLSGSENLLYSFVQAPTNLNTLFLGFFDLTKPSIVFAILAGLSQFIQLKFSLSNQKVPEKTGQFKDELARTMQFQMKYILPIFIAFISLKLSAAVALYWITSNIITTIQEYFIRRAPIEPVRLIS